MNYELNVEEVSSIRRRLHFTLSGDVVGGELNRAYRDLKKRIRLPGFRPGKVPRKLWNPVSEARCRVRWPVD